MSHIFQQMLHTEKIPRSLLLVGASRAAALDMAKQLLGPSQAAKVDSGNHPDLHVYVPEGKSHLHPVANINKLIREMALPPFEAKCKIFLIEEAEKMLPSSSNALLKTLEEPNEDTFFLLLSDQPDRLLPTVLSRLHPLSMGTSKFDSVDVAPYVMLAQKQEWDRLLDEFSEEDSQAFLHGCLLWAVKSQNPLLFQQISNLVQGAQKALEHNLKERNVILYLLIKIERLLAQFSCPA